MRHAILGLLASGPVHGYEIRSEIERKLLPRGRLNVGHVYTSLDRLERDGWVCHERVAQAERPDKKVYRLTPSGREELDRWLEAPCEVPLELRSELFLKIVLARRVRGADPVQVIRTQRRAVFERLHEVTQARARAGSVSIEESLLLELAELRLDALIRWLDRCEEVRTGEARP